VTNNILEIILFERKYKINSLKDLDYLQSEDPIILSCPFKRKPLTNNKRCQKNLILYLDHENLPFS
jgi:hypothetical protein